MEPFAYAPASSLASFRAAVDALPLRKREKWHDCCDDNRGVMHRVRYRNGGFEMKTHSDGRPSSKTGWLPLMSFEEAYGKYGVELLRSEEGLRVAAAYADDGDFGVTLEITRIANEAATGNHHNNPKKVRVPTQPGQPVRG